MKGKHRFHPIECLPLYCLKLFFIKIVSVSVMLLNTTTGPDSKLKLTAIGILKPFIHLWIFPFGLKQ